MALPRLEFSYYLMVCSLRNLLSRLRLREYQRESVHRRNYTKRFFQVALLHQSQTMQQRGDGQSLREHRKGYDRKGDHYDDIAARQRFR